MLRDGTVERITDQVCSVLESNGNAEARNLSRSMQTAVWLCMFDSPHGQQLDNPQQRLVERIRLAVESLLRNNGLIDGMTPALRSELERAIAAGIENRTFRPRRSGHVGSTHSS